MIELVDMHMHLGFSPEASKLACDLDVAQVAIFANTVTPEEYYLLEPLKADARTLRVGLGFHPWQIDASDSDRNAMLLESFLEMLDETSDVGEIGLDFSAKHVESKDRQLECFERIMTACGQRKGLLISMHSIGAEAALLDMIEAHGISDSSSVVLHSYGGASDQMHRALELGAYFSIGTRMLKTKRGREYARVIPEDRLLIESDLPSSNGMRVSARELEEGLCATLDELAAIRKTGREGLQERITARSLALLGLEHLR